MLSVILNTSLCNSGTESPAEEDHIPAPHWRWVRLVNVLQVQVLLALRGNQTLGLIYVPCKVFSQVLGSATAYVKQGCLKPFVVLKDFYKAMMSQPYSRDSQSPKQQRFLVWKKKKRSGVGVVSKVEASIIIAL